MITYKIIKLSNFSSRLKVGQLQNVATLKYKSIFRHLNFDIGIDSCNNYHI